MNRTIKFRGKRVDNGKWVYGYLSYNQWHNSYAIGTGNYGSSLYQIIPETVGQFTGLHDKNGKEIYEGDLVKIPDYSNGAYFGRYQPMKTIEVKFIKLFNGIGFPGLENQDLEITGNIHDND